MLLLTDTWSAACCWFSVCTICSMAKPLSASHCSTQVRVDASAALRPCRRRANSATNALVIGGVERAMSAMINTTLFGSLSAASMRRSAHSCARSRSVRSAITRALTRRRFSIKASRSMIGIAHSSPSFSGVIAW